MSLLFYADTEKRVILHPEVVKLVPALSVLSNDELLFVVLFTDYNSPYKQLPEHERKRRAMQHAFEDSEIELIESDRIKIAIMAYNSLQYSPKIEACRQFQKKIDSLLISLQEDTAPSNISKTLDAISKLKATIAVYEKEYDDDILKKGVLKGGMTLSWLEEIMSNQKLFESVTARK